MTQLQNLVTRLFALLGSMDSYDHFGHGFHFFKPAVMDEMDQQRLALLDEINGLIRTWRRDDTERFERWIAHNEAVLHAAVQRLEANPNATSRYHITRCNELLTAWSEQRRRAEFSIPLQSYWGLGVEGF